jgi:nucleotide-binding universal stress UspA family protein
MPLSRILVPVDFSERSMGAARYAEALHDVFSSSLTLLHVLPPPHYEFGAMELAGSVLEEQFRNRAELASKDLENFMAEELPAPHTQRIVREGDPAGVIVALAHEGGTGLIVMPTHGYGPFRRFILGSVTAKVLHDADCPVCTGVHMETPSSHAVHFRQVTAAIDLGAQSERTLMWAARFAQDAGARLALVHAMPSMPGRAGESYDAEYRTRAEASVRQEIAELQQRLGIDAPLHVQSGDPARTVCEIASDLESDVLVIGRGSAAGVFGRLRANAYSIIRQGRCPVVSV